MSHKMKYNMKNNDFKESEATSTSAKNSLIKLLLYIFTQGLIFRRREN